MGIEWRDDTRIIHSIEFPESSTARERFNLSFNANNESQLATD